MSLTLPLRKPKTWPYATTSTGRLRGSLPLGSLGLRVQVYEAIGEARKTYIDLSKRFIGHLNENADEIRVSGSYVDLSLFMVGRSPEQTKPIVMIVSQDKKARLEAFRLINKSGIMDDYPGFDLGHMPLKDEFKNLQPLGEVAKTSSTQHASSIIGQITDETVLGLEIFSPASDTRTEGRCLYTRADEPKGAGNTTRNAAAGGLVFCNGEYYIHTVAHFLLPPSSKFPCPPSTKSLDEDDEWDATGLSDFEDDEEHGRDDLVGATSRGSQTPESSASNEDFDDSDSSRPPSIRRSTGSHSPLHGIHEHLQCLEGELDTSTLVELQEPPLGKTLSRVGSFQASSTPGTVRIGRVALVSEVHDSAFIRLDVTQPSGWQNAVPLDDLATHIETAAKDTAVQIRIANGGTINGILYGTPSYIRLPYTKKFQQVYAAKLETPLAPGDCGSWVRDASTGKLFGHVVAGSPTTGLAIVLPAIAALTLARIALQRSGLTERTDREATSHCRSRRPAHSQPSTLLLDQGHSTSYQAKPSHPVIPSLKPMSSFMGLALDEIFSTRHARSQLSNKTRVAVLETDGETVLETNREAVLEKVCRAKCDEDGETVRAPHLKTIRETNLEILRETDPKTGAKRNRWSLAWQELDENEFKDRLEYWEGSSRATEKTILIFYESELTTESRGTLTISKELFEWMCETLNIPAVFVQAVFATPWKAHTCGQAYFVESNLERDEAGKVTGVTIFYHFQSELQFNRSYIFTRYCLKTNTSTNICVNCVDSAKVPWATVIGPLRAQEAYRSPFSFHLMLLYHILERLDLDAEKLRTKVLHYEIRIQEPADLAFETWNLHRLSQDMHVLTEYYADVEAKIQFLKQAYRAYRDSSWVRTRQAIMRQDLEHLEAMWWRTSVSKQWIVTYKDRVNILINHVFHISSQEQARATAAIAQDAAKESSAMGTVAAVTLFFLPPTFVCAIFGMDFFVAGDQTSGLRMSSYWWLYPATAVPLIIVVIATWILWHRSRLERKSKSLANLEAGMTLSNLEAGMSMSSLGSLAGKKKMI